MVQLGSVPFCIILFEVFADDREGLERQIFLEKVGQVDTEKDGVDYECEPTGQLFLVYV